MEPRQIFRSGITASALAHLSCLLLVIFFAEVHPFSTVTAEPIAVDIVAPEEVAKETEQAKPPELPPKEKEKPSDSLDLSSKVDSKADSSAKTATASPSPPAAASAPPPATKPAAPPPSQKQAALAPPTPPQPAAAAPAASPAPVPGQPPGGQQRAAPMPPAQPAYVAPQPDLSFQYPVLLGGLPQDRAGDGFDAPATEKADVGNDMVAEFRKHLKTCSKLPEDIAPSDQVAIKIRVAMTPEGRLAAEPVLIEAKASMKGPLLMRSAISALEACQPYTMLPADKYRQWKVLDLVFTPRDFTGAS